jgi:hypothetical protein
MKIPVLRPIPAPFLRLTTMTIRQIETTVRRKANIATTTTTQKHRGMALNIHLLCLELQHQPHLHADNSIYFQKSSSHDK